MTHGEGVSVYSRGINKSISAALTFLVPEFLFTFEMLISYTFLLPRIFYN